MKLLQFSTSSQSGRQRHLGALIDGTADGGTLVDLTAAGRVLFAREHVSAAGIDALVAALAPASMLAFVEGGVRTRDVADRALDEVLTVGDEYDDRGARVRYDSSEITLLPAITAPPMLRDFMAFEEHLLNVFPKLGREIPDEWYRRPVYYKGNTASIGAHRQDVEFPPYAEQLDLEFEFAAIIGRGGSDIPEGDAREHIFGYTVYNDLSARSIQALEMTVGLGPAKGKDFHNGHVLGPVVVTADEIPDPYALAMTGTVNGETWTNTSSADMTWRFEQMISYASMAEPLRAGEVFGSGTAGNGSGAEQGRWLDPGDEIELTVEGIGTLRNRVVARGKKGTHNGIA